MTITSGSSAAFANGVATFQGFTLSGTVSSVTTIQFSAFSTSIASGNVTLVAQTATHIVVTTQPTSTVASGAAFATQPVVTIEDGSNVAVAADGSTVTATVTGGAGTVTKGTAVAVNGVATFSGLAVNTLVGNSYTLTFTDGSFTAQSNAFSVTVGNAAKLTILRQPSTSVQSGSVLPTQPIVAIQDSGGNIVTTNTSTVVAVLTAGSGTVSGGAVAASLGQVNYTAMTINAPAGLYSLTFSDGSLTPAVSTNINVGAGVASKLVITTQPSSSVASGVALTVQPVVKVEDSGGNVITGTTSTVTAVITAGTNTAVNNTATVNSSTGTATFAGLALNALVGTYTLTFSDGALTTAISTSITVTPGAASKLAVTTQPSAIDASGVPLAIQPVVKVEDAVGNVVTTDGSVVTARITTGGVSLTAPTATAVFGVATFAGTALNALVGPYTLTFTDGTLTAAVSTSITVVVGPGTKIVASTEPSSSAASGVALPTQPVIKVVDSGGNLVTSVSSGSATATVYSGAGGTVSAGSTAPFSAGIATFSGLTITGISGSTYTLLFTGASFSLVDTTQIHLGAAQATLSVTSLKGVLGRSLRLTTTGGSGSGALSFAVTGGSASGCKVSGVTLTFSGTGTCIVTATKAGDSIYVATTSQPATIVVSKLAIPAAVRVNFKANSSALTAAARSSLVALSKKLTTRSRVSITGYARGNLGLAIRRASAVSKFLNSRVRVHVRFYWDTRSSLSAVRLVTTQQ
ncbi:MAG: hypothetical protein KGJ36_01480 [Acidobacteriota bacterium]|nr:hypothetical protein [Acidobacteriota bacterium]